jgi:hypothetical protein
MYVHGSRIQYNTYAGPKKKKGNSMARRNQKKTLLRPTNKQNLYNLEGYSERYEIGERRKDEKGAAERGMDMDMDGQEWMCMDKKRARQARKEVC